MSTIRVLRPAACLVLLAAVTAPAQKESLAMPGRPAGMIAPSVQREYRAAIDRGLDWLASKQADNGAWSNTNFPALTALATWTFLNSNHPKAETAAQAGLAYIMTCVQPDGGIYRTVAGRKGGGLSNYNTAICMTVLHASNDRKYEPVVLNAREFIAGAQHFGDDIYRGGFGYDRETKRAYTDLLNTTYAVQAMRLTEDVEDRRPGDKKVDIDWDAAVDFVERMQNEPGAGEENAGGFFYNPTDPKAGTTETDDGVVIFRSYGSITYSGLLSMIYAQLDRNDPRVRSAFDWAFRHWTLDENPGMGQQGLYYFYNVLARALSAAGHTAIPVGDDQFLNWREAVARKLVSLQKIEPDGDGYWVNENGRYWESDPVLVTSYALLALQAL